MSRDEAIAPGATASLFVAADVWPDALLDGSEIVVRRELEVREADLVVVDRDHPDRDVIAAKAARLARPVVLASADPDPEAIPLPAERPVALWALRRALMLACAQAPMGPAESPLDGASKPMRVLRDTIERAARTEATILVRGETGTGKEVVAREIHRLSGRRGPFVDVHCAALPDSLLESELFGHERGAFTGASSRRIGRLEQAHGGTLFLDEIGDISPPTQVKLLRILQERSFSRLGGNERQEVDLRFVAATHRDLEELARRGEFREDLLFRLNVVPVWVPPLRTRRGDVAMLTRRFCDELAAHNRKGPMHFDDEALAAMKRLPWPGNVRELRNFVERLVVLTAGPRIGVDDIERERGRHLFGDAERHMTSISVARQTVSEVLPLKEEMRATEKKAIERALRHAEGNRSQAARLLGISRAAFYCKLKEHGIS